VRWVIFIPSHMPFFKSNSEDCIKSVDFYHPMHYSAKRSHVVCLSVCDVAGSGPHRLKILETNCSPKVIHLLPGEHGEILVRKCSFNTYVHNVQLNWVNRESRDRRWRCDCLFTFVGTSRGHLCDSTAFLFDEVTDKNKFGSFLFMHPVDCRYFCQFILKINPKVKSS